MNGSHWERNLGLQTDGEVSGTVRYRHGGFYVSNNMNRALGGIKNLKLKKLALTFKYDRI